MRLCSLAAAGYSVDDKIPNADFGLELTPIQWNPVGGGYGSGNLKGLHNINLDKAAWWLMPNDVSVLREV